MCISKQWTIGPPVLEIWWSCTISGGPDLADCQYFLSNHIQLTEFTFSCSISTILELTYIKFNEKDIKA